MTGPVHLGTQWRSSWYPVGPEDRLDLIEDLRDQIRGEFPDSTEVQRLQLLCYPRHTLLRFVVPSGGDEREAYAFYAPGQIYPIDWRAESLNEFNEVALELRNAKQAEDYLRFFTWLLVREGGRSFLVSDADQLRLRDGATLDEKTERRLADALTPLEPLPAEEGDAPDAFRFRGPLLYEGWIRAMDFVVQPSGCSGTEAEGVFDPIEVPVADDRIRGDRYFVLVRETSLTADRFLRRIRQGPLHQARVTEPVSLQNLVFEEPVDLSQVTFEHGADFEGAEFQKGLSLERCVIEGRLSLRDARIQGPLHASLLTFHRDGPHREDASLERSSRFGRHRVDLDASGMSVDGALYLEGLRAVNVVDLSRVKIAGDVRLGGSRLGEPREPSAEPLDRLMLRLDGAQVAGDLDLVYTRSDGVRLGAEAADAVLDETIPGFSVPRTIVRGNIVGRRIDVRGEIVLGGLRCEGDLTMNGATVRGNLQGSANPPDQRLVVLGNLSVGYATIGGGVFVHGAHIGGELGLFSCRIRGSLLGRTAGGFEGRDHPVHVGGELMLSGTEVDDVHLEGSRIGRFVAITGRIGRLGLVPGIEAVEPADAGARDAEAASPVESPRSVRLVPFRAGGVYLSDLTVGKRIFGQFAIDGGGSVELANVECGGELNLCPYLDADLLLADGEAWADGATPRPADLATVVPEGVHCTGLHIEGRAVLTNLRSGERILFKNCEIAQDLEFAAHGPDPHSKEGRTLTECSHIDLELTRVGGDVDLSGLSVSGDGDSSLHARQLQVSGRILFARPLGDRPDQVDALSGDEAERVQARIDGDVDLSVAEAAHLVLAGTGVGGRIDLERGRFRRLQVVAPWLLEGHRLSDAQVERWDIPDDQLLVFLSGSEPFDRSAYVEIERVLRNRAQDAEADRVYRAMRARAIAEARKERREARRAPSGRVGWSTSERWWTRAGSVASYLLRTAGSRMQGLLYGWGTLYWAPLLVFSLLFVPVTWGMFSNPDNIVLSPELLAASGAPFESARPADVGVDWGASDGLWLTIRYHVPVVPLTAREEFRPSQEPAELTLPGLGVARLPFSAESYAFSIYLLNWILWPLFLVGLARRIVRETT